MREADVLYWMSGESRTAKSPRCDGGYVASLGIAEPTMAVCIPRGGGCLSRKRASSAMDFFLPLRRLPATLGLCILAASASFTALAHSYTGMVSFGDSLSDGGNTVSLLTEPEARFLTGYNPNFYFTNRYFNGPVWVDQLYASLRQHLSAIAHLPTDLKIWRAFYRERKTRDRSVLAEWYNMSRQHLIEQFARSSQIIAIKIPTRCTLTWICQL